MRRYLLIALLVAGASPVLALAGSEKANDLSDEECVINFSVEGTFFKGKTYRTWRAHNGRSYPDAFRSVAQALARSNWSGIETDKELGIISAGQPVTMGKGAVAPLSIVINKKGEDVIRVEATFSTAGGQKAATRDVRNELCELVNAPSEDG